MSSGNRHTIEIASSMSEVFALRDTWQSFAADPNADIDVYREIVQGRSEVLKPHVIVLKQSGIVHSVLAGRIESRAVEVSLGYTKISLPGTRFLTMHGGLLGDASEVSVSRMLESVVRSLKEREADVAWFHGVDESSALYHIARSMGGFLTRDHFPRSMQRWQVQIPRTYPEFFRHLSGNTRHNLKRYSKRLRDNFGAEIAVRSFQSPGDLEWILADTEIVAAKTYHRGMGVGFVLNDETRRLFTLAANRGWLRAYILYISGKPSAFWNGFLYGRTFFAVTTGYDPQLREFRPGMFLLQRMLEEICADGTVNKVDFGFGDAQYKRDLCDQHSFDSSFLLFAPNFRGVSLNLVRTPLMFAARLARAVLSRVGALEGIKRGWRDRLAGRRQTLQDTSAATHQGGPAAVRH